MSSQDSPESLAVSKVPLFKSLQYADLMSLLFFVEQKSFKKDENLFDKGDEPNGMYILMAGSLRVYVPPTQTGGAIKSLADLGPGKYVGEFGLIDELPRSASVLALEDCKVLFLPTTAFKRAIGEHPSIATSVCHVLCDMIVEQPKLKINSSKGFNLIQTKNIKPDLENMQKLVAILREHNKNLAANSRTNK